MNVNRGFLIGIMFVYGSLTAQKSIVFGWLEGSWKIETGRGTIIETWKIMNDSTLSGQSVFIAGNESMPQENIQLKFRNSVWYYHPIPMDHRESNSTLFKVILINKDEFISENPAHDFPQRICYRRIKEQLFASIEGENQGNYVKQNFDFVKK